MEAGTRSANGSHLPQVEVWIAESRVSAAAGGRAQEGRLSSEQIAALQQALAALVAGFRPPEAPEEGPGLRLDTMEVELGFTVETAAGSVLKLLLDAGAKASITAKVVWSRSK